MDVETVYVICLVIIGIIIGSKIAKIFIYPKLAKNGTKEIERNPKWIVSKIQGKYYGFDDIDFVIAESTSIFVALPRLQVTQQNGRIKYEMLLPDDVLTRDVDKIIKLALIGKIKVKYGLHNFDDKPIHWLSILCYMLDGGDIKEEATSWEKTHSEKVP